MADCFQLLGVPRRPWLEPEPLKDRFHALALELHPDRDRGPAQAEASRRSADLNHAYNTLRNTRERLAHLIELETGARPAAIQQIPPAAVDLAMRAAMLSQQADKFLQGKRAAASPILQAQMMSEGMDWAEKLEALRKELEHRRQFIEQELRELNSAWEAREAGQTSALPLARLEELHRAISFLARWEGQLQDRALQATI